jgi:thymidylate synthase (FAD)
MGNNMKVELIDLMGGDLTVVNSARVSFDKIASKVKESDQKLIRYLAAHDHWTPFGHVQAQFRIKAPVFVARQLVKHQVGMVWNETSLSSR